MAMEVTYRYLWYVVLTMAHIYPALSRNNKLYGADPSGGIWGVSLSESADGIAELIVDAGYTSDLYSNQITSVSYDSLSKRMLFETQDPHRISYAPLCNKKADSPRVITDIGSAPLHDSAMGDCVNCKISAFTLYDSRLYFIITGEYFAPSGEIHRVAQIRYLLSCEECPSSKSAAEYQFVDTVACSHLVAEVLHDVFDPYTIDDIEIKGGKNMVISENDEGTLDFFFHFGNITRSDSQGDKITLSLWHANSDGSAQALRHEMVDSRFADWAMSALGSVSYKDGTLCWTTGTLVMCGDFSGGRLQMVKMVMGPAGAVLADVCRGSDYNLLAIVSGIAVLRGGDHRVVAFACYPDEPGSGGVGIMRIGRTEENAEIRPVSIGEQRVLAGAMFSHRIISKKCDWGDELPICLGPPPPTTAPPTTPEVTTSTTTEHVPEEVADEGKDPNYEIEGNAIDNGQTGKEEAKPVSDRESGASVYLSPCFAVILPLLTALLL